MSDGDCIVGLRLRVMDFIFLFLSIFSSFFPYVGVFSKTFKARMLKLGMHMDNELLYCGIWNRTPSLKFFCFFFFFFFFLSFKAKYVSLFSPELCKLESSNVVYMCRMSDCIVGLRFRVMALIFLFSIQFSFFPYITC